MSVEVAADATDPLFGEILASRYQIESKLGEGAMGAVYKARHVKVGRPFAVKVLHKKLLEDRKTLQRFEREAELAGRLHHTNVIGVVDVGETSTGDRYMVMDFAEGDDLATLLAEAPMPPARIINLTKQMLEGLYHAHEAGLIHRDFKPENVIVERDDHDVEVPRIVDFGIAILREGGDGPNAAGRLTTNGLVLGTPHYMAPEQAVADPIDHRIDLFALGIVVYEMLCARLPFDGSGAEVARANLLLDPPPISQRVPFLEVDPLLEAFARRLMAKKRDHRPATAKAARELLDLIATDRPAAAAALGVSLDASRRQPADTAPQRPVRDPDLDDSGEHPEPVIVETPASAIDPTPTPRPVEAPPVHQSALATRPAPAPGAPSHEHAIRTEIADPLDYARPTSRSRWVFVIAGGVAAAAIATIIILQAGGGGSSDAPADESERKIVMQATPPEVTPPPAPVVEPVTEPDHEAVAAPDEGASADAATEPEVIDMGSEPMPSRPMKRQVKRPRAGKGRPARPRVAQPDKPARPDKPAQPDATRPDPTPAKPAAPDAAAVSALYAQVGRDLAAAAAARGEDAVAQLKTRYRRIRLADVLPTEAKRTAAHAKLRRLRAELAPLRR